MDKSSAGLVETLFDLSFRNFITPKIVAILYVIMIVLSCLWTLMFVIAGFSSGEILAGLGALVISPIVLALLIVMSRVYMELLIVAFKGVEYLRKIAGEPKDEPATEASA